VTLQVVLEDGSTLRTTKVVPVEERIPAVFELFRGTSARLGYEASPFGAYVALYVQSIQSPYEEHYDLLFLDKREFNFVWEPTEWEWGKPGEVGLMWSGDVAAIPYISDVSSNRLVIADVRTQTVLREIQLPPDLSEIQQAAISPNGLLAAVSGMEEGDVISVLSVASGREVRSLKRSFRGPILFNPAGSLLIAGGLYGIEMWDTTTWSALPALPGSEDSYGGGVAISPDGLQMAIGTYERGVLLVDLRTGEVVRELGEKDRLVYSLTWSKDGRVLALATDDLTAEVIDVATGRAIATVVSPNGGDCSSVTFSSDGTLLAAVFGPLFVVYDLSGPLREAR
jgi:hypothetical protein